MYFIIVNYIIIKLTKYSSITKSPIAGLNSFMKLLFKSRHRSSTRLKNLHGKCRNLFDAKFSFLNFFKDPISSGKLSNKLSCICRQNLFYKSRKMFNKLNRFYFTNLICYRLIIMNTVTYV